MNAHKKRFYVRMLRRLALWAVIYPLAVYIPATAIINHYRHERLMERIEKNAVLKACVQKAGL